MAIAIAAAAFILGALFGAAAVLVDRANGTRLIPGDFFTESPRERVARIEHVDERIDSAEKAMFFGASLFTHNIQVSFLAFSLGALTYVGALWLLFYNGVILGAIATMYVLDGVTTFFVAWVGPHGALELPSIIFGAAAGLLAGRALLMPGDLTRAASLRRVLPSVWRMMIGTALTLVFAAMATLPAGIALAVTVSANFLLTWGWHVYFETQHAGRSPGKRALRLRVVDARGLPISLHQALVRNVMRAVDFAPAFYGFAAISTLVDPRRRRLGDLVADTLVIREARPLAWQSQLGSERRYNSLRTARVLRLIRHRIGLEEREFLLALCMRAEKMTPEARYDLMEEVAAAYRAKLSIDDDEPISGENFVRDLTAVLFAARPAARAA